MNRLALLLALLALPGLLLACGRTRGGGGSGGGFPSGDDDDSAVDDDDATVPDDTADDDDTPADDDDTPADDDDTPADDDDTPTDDDDTPTDDDDTPTDDDDALGSYGPPNAWSHTDEDPSGLFGTGWRTGDTAYNFTLVDQNGDQLELYQFLGKVVVIDVFAEWCGPCNANAPEGEVLWQAGGGEVVLIGAMQQDSTGASASSASDAARWASTHGLSHPVVADATESQTSYVVTGFPTYVVIDRDMEIVNDDLWPFDVNYVLGVAGL